MPRHLLRKRKAPVKLLLENIQGTWITDVQATRNYLDNPLAMDKSVSGFAKSMIEVVQLDIVSDSILYFPIAGERTQVSFEIQAQNTKKAIVRPWAFIEAKRKDFPLVTLELQGYNLRFQFNRKTHILQKSR